MKKILAIALMFLMIIASGCPGPERDKPQDDDSGKKEVMNIDMKAAKEFMDNYMRYVLKRDIGAMKSFYSSKIKSEIRDVPQIENPHPIAYKLEEGENKEKNAEFKAHIYNGYTGEPYFSDDTFKYTVTMDNGRMVIDKIEKESSIEIFKKGKALYKREGDKAKGQYAISIQDLPYYVVPKGALSPEQKFPAPREEFGPCALSPDGKSMVITSTGPQTLLAMVKWEENEEQSAMSQQGKEKNGQGGGDSKEEKDSKEDQGKEEKGNEEQQNIEKQQNPTVKPIDFYFDGKVNMINFSPDGNMFLVEQTMTSGLKQVLVYQSETGEPINLSIYNLFKKDTFSIVNPYFKSENQMVFTVIPINGATREEQKLKGDYILDIKSQKLIQIE
jgi:hypothetical protein